MNMQSAAGLADGNLGRERDIVAEFAGEIADLPFCNHKLVGGIHGGNGQEFDFVLFVYFAV